MILMWGDSSRFHLFFREKSLKDWHSLVHVLSCSFWMCDWKGATATVDGSEILLTSWGWKLVPLFTGFCTSQVVQDFFHQQYERKEQTLAVSKIKILFPIPQSMIRADKTKNFQNAKGFWADFPAIPFPILQHRYPKIAIFERGHLFPKHHFWY